MERNKTIENTAQGERIKHKQCNAFHEAGYAAAIYLNNKAGKLPPVIFQITLQNLNGGSDESGTADVTRCDNGAVTMDAKWRVELLSPASEDYALCADNNNAMAAFEAGVINRLIGALAEAKHVADRDDELFNQKLITLDALKYYGGSHAIQLTAEYVRRFSDCKQQQDQKLHALLIAAFDFVTDRTNWAAITRLATCMLNGNNDVIGGEQVAALITEAISAAKRSRIAGDKPAAILFVDDEVYVLNALRRLFHNEPYVSYFATSGAEGLTILQQHRVDLIISDMRMPEMNGAEFFAQVVQQWPETIRILLTGYADMQSTIDAVNKGRIYHYYTKPWNDEELKLLVRHALEQKAAARKA